MKFFVPYAAPGSDEQTYVQLAAFARRSVEPPGRRIASISFRHDSTPWVATVGEPLTGTQTKSKRIRATKGRPGRTVSIETPVHDPAVVLAIFAGVPYMVVTDAAPLGASRTAWENPFMAGQPTGVFYFEP